MFGSFRTRSNKLERIDTGDYTAAEYELWQREMVFIHRWFGETRAIRRKLVGLGSGSSVLDVGAGSGELLNSIRSFAGSDKVFLCGADIDAAAAKTISVRGFSGLQCSGTALPFSDSSVDHVICSLMFHHLSDAAAIVVLREMARVSRRGVHVLDLRRSMAAYLGYYAFASLFFQRFTRDDGSLSIRRGFVENELQEIGEQAGLRNLTVETSALFRLVLSGTK